MIKLISVFSSSKVYSYCYRKLVFLGPTEESEESEVSDDK